MRFFDELSYIKYKLGIGKILIAIVLIHILIILANSIIVNQTIKSIKNDAILINSGGMIRGGIQRVVKLTLEDKLNQDEIMKIDAIFEKFSVNYEKFASKHIMQDFYEKLRELQRAWIELKNILASYEKNQTEDIREQIYNKSENVWKISVETLTVAENLYENKINSFGSIFAILLIDFSLVIIVILIINKNIRLNLEIVASTDTLTNIGNRNRYNEAIEIYLNLFKKYNKKIAYILLDIDFFKSINDNFGHDKGDDVLIKSTKVILTNIKKDDLFCRVGGEEFVIVSENINTKDELEKFANKIRTSVENFDFELERKVTISLGATFIEKDDTKHSLFKRADEALYISKNSGRNRVTIL
ncbi:GGDEF domain-containing protein [Aliarcobacter cryaerophilus]|uniref:GGDEF domain-containing protein n=1 Tax=Aliarcobacter cryaerophilus TaxID=28198 RepID=UPI003DA35594